MSRNVIIATALAKRDISDIATYIAGDNPAAAARFGADFQIALDRLADFPEIGRPLPNLETPVFAIRVSRTFRKYLIFYRRQEETIEIVRVLHGSRDIAEAIGR